MAFLLGTPVSQPLKNRLTRNNIVVLPDDDRIDRPAPTNDCEQLVALFIRGRAARSASCFLTGPQTTVVKVACTLKRGNFTMDEDSKKFSES
jgi:hypothetical protein